MIPCRLYGFTRWGYNFAPITCESVKEAKAIAKENEDNGYWFSHIIEKLK